MRQVIEHGGSGGGSTGRRRALLVAFAAAAVVLLCAASAWAGRSPFRYDLHRIDARLRMGIEYAPVELGEGLSASETVCRLGEKAEERGDAEGAAADRSTLSQLVDELDRPALARVDGALQRADTGLLELRDKYAAAWSDRAKLAQLRRGVARAREGVGRLRAAMGQIAASFDAWQLSQCQAATDAINTGIAHIPAAISRINVGMRLLWDLALDQANPRGPADRAQATTEVVWRD